MSFVIIFMKIDCVITAPHCISVAVDCCTLLAQHLCLSLLKPTFCTVIKGGKLVVFCLVAFMSVVCRSHGIILFHMAQRDEMCFSYFKTSWYIIIISQILQNFHICYMFYGTYILITKTTRRGWIFYSNARPPHWVCSMSCNPGSHFIVINP